MYRKARQQQKNILPAELGHCQEPSQVSVLSVPFHWSKKKQFS